MPDTLKILRVCASSLFAKTALLPEIDYLLDNGWSVDMAFPEDQSTESLVKKGYKIIIINDIRSISIIPNMKAIIKLYRLIITEKYDLVHSHNHIIGALTRIAAKLAGAPHIVHSPHGFYFHEHMPRHLYWFYHTLEKCLGWISDLVFIENWENMGMCQKTNLIPNKKIYHIGSGIDLTRFHGKKLSLKKKNSLMKKLGIPRNAFPIIGITSRLTYEKGYRELIQSIVELRKQYPNINLLIVGAVLNTERNNFYPELQELIKKYSLQEQVTITLEENVEDFLRLMDIFTLPSYREGFPRSIQEAMAMCLPVVATDIRGCRNLVIQGKTGFLIPPKNSKALTVALMKLINNNTLREQYGRAGRDYIEKNHSNKIVIEKMMAGYYSLIQ